MAYYLPLEVLSKENIVEPMRDIRRALLEADVSDYYIVCILVLRYEIRISMSYLVNIGKPSCCTKVCASCQ